MSKLQTVLLCILSAMVGAMGSSVFLARYLGSLYNPRNVLAEQVAALHAMSLIKSIQENHPQEAVELAEIELDGQIISLGYSARNGDGKTMREAKMALRRIANHRKKFPYTSEEPELRRAVEEALLLASSQP